MMYDWLIIIPLVLSLMIVFFVVTVFRSRDRGFIGKVTGKLHLPNEDYFVYVEEQKIPVSYSVWSDLNVGDLCEVVLSGMCVKVSLVETTDAA